MYTGVGERPGVPADVRGKALGTAGRRHRRKKNKREGQIPSHRRVQDETRPGFGVEPQRPPFLPLSVTPRRFPGIAEERVFLRRNRPRFILPMTSKATALEHRPYHLLEVGADAHDGHAVVEHADDEGADQGAADGADAAVGAPPMKTRQWRPARSRAGDGLALLRRPRTPCRPQPPGSPCSHRRRTSGGWFSRRAGRSLPPRA